MGELDRRSDNRALAHSRTSFRDWLSDSAAALPPAFVPLAVGLAAIALPHLATAIAIAGALGGGVGAVAEQNARAEFEGFQRLLMRLRDRVKEERRSLSDEQIVDLLARSDFVRFVGEARDKLAVKEMDSRLQRFADVLAGRVLGHGRDFDLDLHLARAALELNDAAVAFLKFVEDAQLAAHRGSFPGMDLVAYCEVQPPADDHALQLLEVGILAAERSGLLFEETTLSGAGRGDARLADGETSRTLTQRWIVPHWGGEFLARIRSVAVRTNPGSGSASPRS